MPSNSTCNYAIALAALLSSCSAPGISQEKAGKQLGDTVEAINSAIEADLQSGKRSRSSREPWWMSIMYGSRIKKRLWIYKNRLLPEDFGSVQQSKENGVTTYLLSRSADQLKQLTLQSKISREDSLAWYKKELANEGLSSSDRTALEAKKQELEEAYSSSDAVLPRSTETLEAVSLICLGSKDIHDSMGCKSCYDTCKCVLPGDVEGTIDSMDESVPSSLARTYGNHNGRQHVFLWD